MRKKYTVLLFLAVLSFLVVGMSAGAQSSKESLSITNLEVITPFYDYVSVVTSSISIGKLGKATASGSVIYFDDYKSTLKLELQQLKDNRWSTIKSWSKSFSGTGSHSFSEDYYVTSGYSYRVVTTVEIINNNGNVLETASSTSSTATY